MLFVTIFVWSYIIIEFIFVSNALQQNKVLSDIRFNMFYCHSDEILTIYRINKSKSRVAYASIKNTHIIYHPGLSKRCPKKPAIYFHRYLEMKLLINYKLKINGSTTQKLYLSCRLICLVAVSILSLHFICLVAVIILLLYISVLSLYLCCRCICLVAVSVLSLYLSCRCICFVAVSVLSLYLFRRCICLVAVSVLSLYLSYHCICVVAVSVL